MHEYAIATSLLRMVEDRARAAGGTRVVRVDVRVGDAVGVDAELLATAWEILRNGGPCASAELRLHRVAARWECPRCGASIPDGDYLRCPSCSVPASLASGAELMLDRMEVERGS